MIKKVKDIKRDTNLFHDLICSRVAIQRMAVALTLTMHLNLEIYMAKFRW